VINTFAALLATLALISCDSFQPTDRQDDAASSCLEGDIAIPSKALCLTQQVFDKVIHRSALDALHLRLLLFAEHVIHARRAKVPEDDIRVCVE